MSTLNPPRSSADIRPEPAAEADTFGTNVGDMIAQNVDLPPTRGPLDQDTDLLHAEMDESQPSRCNVGRTEQKLRLGMGAALLTAAAFAPVSRGWRIGFAIVGAAELITGTTRYCPVSRLLGINTCRGEERESAPV